MRFLNLVSLNRYSSKMDKKMHIVFDMDNTLVDEFGRSTRPGMKALLQTLKKRNTLSIFTTSTKARARKILRDHNLLEIFAHVICREDYAPNENDSLLKDIRIIKGDVLVDDDPKQVRHMKKLGKRGVQVSAFRHGKLCPENELNIIKNQLKSSWWNRLIL